MGFEFKDHSINVEIMGKTYAVDVNKAETQDALTKAQAEFNKYDAETLAQDEQANYKVSCALRNMISALIGEDNMQEVFANRPHCVIDEAELVMYIYKEVEENSDKLSSIDDLMQELGVGNTTSAGE